MDTENRHAPRLTTVEPVAQYLGISRARAYSMARAGILPSVRIGRSVMFDRLAIERFIAEKGSSWAHGWRKERP